MNPLNLLEAERHLELDVGGRICIVGQLLMVVVTVFIITQPKSLVPFQACLFPLFEPLQLGAGAHEKLHLHLLELAHTENELAGHNLVAECLTDLCDTEWNAHTARFLHIQIVHENALRCFRTQINRHGAVGRRTHFGLEHQVELAHVSPVPGAAYWVNNLLVDDNLAKLLKIIGIHRIGETLVQCVTLRLMLQHTRIGLAEHNLVETLAEAFGGLGHLLLYFILDFGNLLLDKHIGTIAFLGIAVVNQRVIECINMP